MQNLPFYAGLVRPSLTSYFAFLHIFLFFICHFPFGLLYAFGLAAKRISYLYHQSLHMLVRSFVCTHAHTSHSINGNSLRPPGRANIPPSHTIPNPTTPSLPLPPSSFIFLACAMCGDMCDAQFCTFNDFTPAASTAIAGERNSGEEESAHKIRTKEFILTFTIWCVYVKSSTHLRKSSRYDNDRERHWLTQQRCS